MRSDTLSFYQKSCLKVYTRTNTVMCLVTTQLDLTAEQLNFREAGHIKQLTIEFGRQFM